MHKENDDDPLYTNYLNTPENEKQSGNFSETSISSHHSIMVRKFYEDTIAHVKTSTLNHLFSCCLIILIPIAYCKNHGVPVSESFSVISFIIFLWVTSFVIFNVPRIVAYPTRKNAKQDLEIISSCERESKLFIFKA